MLVGYARVSTLDQKPALQTDALMSAGCERIFTEKASGAQREEFFGWFVKISAEGETVFEKCSPANLKDLDAFKQK